MAPCNFITTAPGKRFFGYNRWLHPTIASDLGIGSAPQANTDWTFAENAASYTSRRLRVYVRPLCTAELIANWTFDTDFRDVTTNAHHGAAIGDAFAGNTSTPSPLATGYLSLDGVGDQVDVPILVSTSSYSKAAWIWLSSTNGVQSIFDADATGNHALHVVDGRLQVFHSNRMLSSTSLINTGEWIHVATSYDHLLSEISLYQNGSLQNCELPGVQPAQVSGTNDHLGGTNNLHGAIDDAAVWSAALTSVQIEALYTDGTNGIPVYAPVATPSNLLVVDSAYNRVDLSWSSVTNASCYRIYRDGQELSTSPIPSFSDLSVVGESNYTYRVAAIGFRGSSLPSAPGITVMTPEMPVKVSFSALPTDLQLVPRDRLSNTGTVSFVGMVEGGSWSSVVVRVYREGISWSSNRTASLNYGTNGAPFSLEIGIPAEVADYSFDLLVDNGSTNQFITAVSNVVAGDIYLIEGQSNAEARLFSGSANGNIDPFVRSFGRAASSPAIAGSDVNWYIAEGDLNLEVGLGRVGQWGLRMGKLLRDQTGIPIAIINGAHGGRNIAFFQRNDSNPLDLSTNYGRLLWRCQMAGVTAHARAMFWYQGESDTGNASGHIDGFLDLHSDWLIDYPNIEQFYVFQLRQEGCGKTDESIVIRDFQRRLPQLLPDFSVMSTTGIDATLTCHYTYADGYETLGNRIAALVARDLYGIGGGLIDAPNPQTAWFNDAF